MFFPIQTPLFPSGGRAKSVAAVNSAFQDDRVIAIFSQKDPRTADPEMEDLHTIGTIATITQMMTTEGKFMHLSVDKQEFHLKKLLQKSRFGRKGGRNTGNNRGIPEVGVLSGEIRDLFKKAINLGKQAEVMTVMKLVSGSVEPIEVSDQVASLLDISPSEKQKYWRKSVLKKT